MMKYMKRMAMVFVMAIMLFGMPQLSLRADATETTDEFQDISGEIEVIFNRSEEDMQKYIDAFEIMGMFYIFLILSGRMICRSTLTP